MWNLQIKASLSMQVDTSHDVLAKHGFAAFLRTFSCCTRKKREFIIWQVDSFENRNHWFIPSISHYNWSSSNGVLIAFNWNTSCYTCHEKQADQVEHIQQTTKFAKWKLTSNEKKSSMIEKWRVSHSAKMRLREINACFDLINVAANDESCLVSIELVSWFSRQ